MRHLVTISQHNIALLFSNYLLSVNLRAQVIESGKDYAIYCHEDDYQQAKTLFDEFIQQPEHPKYQQAAWDGGEVENFINHGPSLVSSFKQQFIAHAGPVTLVVFTLCWLIYIASNIGWYNDLKSLLSFYNHLNLSLLLTEPWRLIGPAFFHFSLLHIAFNTMWWWQLGGQIEQTEGKWSILQLFLLSATISNLGQFIVSGPNFGGLSGVVYAVVGYVWWVGWLAPQRGLQLSKPIIGFLLFWLLLGFAEVLPVNMANTAHLLGLITGCGLAWFNYGSKKR